MEKSSRLTRIILAKPLPWLVEVKIQETSGKSAKTVLYRSKSAESRPTNFVNVPKISETLHRNSASDCSLQRLSDGKESLAPLQSQSSPESQHCFYINNESPGASPESLDPVLLPGVQGEYWQSRKHDQKIGLDDENEVVLVVEGQKVFTTKEVLSRHSDYFHAMFTTDMKESKQLEIELVDVTLNAVKAILQFYLQGELLLCTDQVHYILHAAHQFQMTKICDACEHFLCTILTKENILEILDIADHYNAQRLLQKIYKMIRENFVEFSIRDILVQLKYDQVLALLECDLPINASEFEIFRVIKKWIMDDYPKRLCYLGTLIQHTKFPLMSLHELTLVNKMEETWLKQNGRFLDCLNVTFRYRNHIHEQPLWQSSQTSPRGAVDCLLVFSEDDSILQEDNELSCHVTLLESQMKGFNKKDFKFEWKRDAYAIAVWNNFLFIAGGYDPEADRNLSTVHRYDPATRSWIRVQPMLHRRASFCLQALGDRLVAVGGRQYDSILHDAFHTNIKTLSSTEWYNSKSDCWIKAAAMPVCLYGHAAATSQHQIYISGGRSDNSVNVEDTNAVLRYNSQTDSWTHCASMHHHRYYHNMVNLRDKLYVIGGINYVASQNMWHFVQDFECFDPQTDQWTLLAPLPHRRSQVGVVSYGSVIYVMGGLPYPGVDGRQQVLEYNVDKNEWGNSEIRFPTFWPTACCILKVPPDFCQTQNNRRQ